MAGGHRSVSATLADPGRGGYALAQDGSCFTIDPDIDSSLLIGRKPVVFEGGGDMGDGGA